MAKISNEQLAHDMAMAFVQADLNDMSGTQRVEELSLIHQNVQANKSNSTTIISNYKHYYITILQYLDSGESVL